MGQCASQQLTESGSLWFIAILWPNCILFCIDPVKNCPSPKTVCILGTPSEKWDWQREIYTLWCGRGIRSLGCSAPLLSLLRYFQTEIVPTFESALELILIRFRYQVSRAQTGMGEVRLLPVISISCSLVVNERLDQAPHTVKGDSLRNVTTLLPPLPSDFTGGLIIHTVAILIVWSRTCTLVLLSFYTMCLCILIKALLVIKKKTLWTFGGVI